MKTILKTQFKTRKSTRKTGGCKRKMVVCSRMVFRRDLLELILMAKREVIWIQLLISTVTPCELRLQNYLCVIFDQMTLAKIHCQALPQNLTAVLKLFRLKFIASPYVAHVLEYINVFIPWAVITSQYCQRIWCNIVIIPEGFRGVFSNISNNLHNTL